MKIVLGSKEEKIAEQNALQESLQTPQDVSEPEQTATEADKPVSAYMRAHTEILYENEPERTENGTHYVQNDGTTKAVYAAKAVHYFDEETKAYKDICLDVEESAEAYTVKDNGFCTEFAKQLPQGKIFQMEKHGCKVSLALQEGAPARLQRNMPTAGVNGFALCNVNEQTDINYIVEADRVKEIIVIKEKADAYTYRFSLNIDGLEAALSDDGTFVALKNIVTGDTEFIIPPPFMFDAAGEYSDAVYYEIDAVRNNVLDLIVVADDEFINAEGRAFPVTIDPQIVSNDSNLIRCENYYRPLSTGGAGNWNLVQFNYYKVQKTVIAEYKCNLIIKRKGLNLTNRKITSAVLKLYCSYATGSCNINGKSYRPKQSAYLEVDLTSKILSSDGGDILIELLPNGYANIQFVSQGTFASYLEVEFLTNEKSVPAIEQFSLAGGMTAYANLLTGDPVFTVSELTTDATILPVAVTHVYKRNSADFACGANWRLNLHQTLKKTNDSALDGNFVFTDELGDRHIFKEYFYYLNASGKKQYIDKSAVTVGLDGSLTYNGEEVFKEQKSATGLTVVSKLEGFKNAEVLLQQHEECMQLEQEVANYRNALCEFVRVNMTNTEELENATWLSSFFEGDNIPPETFLSLCEGTVASQIWLTKSEAVQLKNLRNSLNASSRQKTSIENTLASMRKQCEALRLQKQSYVYAREDVERKTEGGPDLSYRSGHYEKLENNIGKQYENMGKQILDVEKSKDTLKEQEDIILAQIQLLMDKRARYLELMRQYYNIYSAKLYQLQSMYRYVPECYLIDQNSVVRAFNAVGNLVAIYDAYENIVTVEYDDDGKIVRLYDGEHKQIRFRYKNGRLLSLQDDNGRTVRYDYSDNILSKITFADGKTLLFTYDTFGSLTAAESSDCIMSKIEYSGKKLLRLTELSLAQSVSKDTVQKNANGTILSTDTFTYSGHQTDITDQDGRARHWLFNAEGNVYAYYATDGGVTTDLLTRDYVTETCTFSVRRKKDAVNLLADVGAKSVSGKMLLAVIPKERLDAKTTDYVFSAYASAMSLQSVMRMKTAFYEQLMDTTNPCCFEICAEVVYPSKTNTFIMSGDYKNVNRQLLALPVSLDENANGDAILPESIRLYANRTSNTSCVFDTFSFCAGEWSYAMLNQFGNPTEEETSWQQLNADSFVKGITEYTYDDDQRVVRKSTDYRFNIDNALVTKTAVETYSYNTQGKCIRMESYVEGEELSCGKDVKETVYNAKGIAVKHFTYNTRDTSSKYYTEILADEQGKIVGETDETGEQKTVYEYKDNSSVVTGYFRTADGGRMRYSVDPASDEVTGITQSTASGEGNSTAIHRTLGLVTELTNGLSTLGYTYDAKRRVQAVSWNGAPYMTYAYTDNGSAPDGTKRKTVTATLANDHAYSTVTDTNGNLHKLSYNGTTQAEFTYTDNLLQKTEEKAIGYTVERTYDELRRLSAVTTAKTATCTVPQLENLYETYTYTPYGEMATHTVGNRTYTYNYDETLQRRCNGVQTGNVSFAVQTDPLGRYGGHMISVNDVPVSSACVYYAKYGDHATNRVSAIRYGQRQNGKFVYRYGEKYSYDEKGNLAAVHDNITMQTKYTYDTLNRLVREDNRLLQKTYLFTYDTNGNRLAKVEAPFTLADRDAVVGEQTGYSYIGDRLFAIQDSNLNYDSAGNPILYKGNELQWAKGRQLTGYGTTTYAYDGLGFRIRKGDIVYTYTADGRLLKQSNGIEFLYCGNEKIGFTYSGSEYFYRKNALGDVIAILDKNSKIMVKYGYNAWGQHTVYGINESDGFSDISDLSHAGNAVHIGNLNPIRYRSYYYDNETGLYYLQTRYYDPEVGRFLNADDVCYIDPESVNGLNLYAYCANNPVMGIDPNGNVWWNPLTWNWGKVGEFFLGLALSLTPLGLIPLGYMLFTNNVSNSLIGGYITGTIIQVVAVLAVFAPELVSALSQPVLTISGGLLSAGGTAALGGTITLTVGQLLAGVASLAGLGLLFIKGTGARLGHNKHENKQFEDAMKEFGIDRKNPLWQQIHYALNKFKKKGGYLESFKDLIDFIRRFLNR